MLGGEGNGGVIDPRVGFVRDSFVGMALVLDLLAADGRAALAAGRRACPGSRWSRTSTRWPARAAAAVAALWDRIAAAHPEARADRRDGLRLDWPDRWVHVRASNTEPIVRVIAEAADAADGPGLADQVGRWVDRGRALSDDLADLRRVPRPPRSSTSTARCWPRPPPICSPASSAAGA